MTISFWTSYWFYWLLAVLLSWLIAEVASIIAADIREQKSMEEWTLSDTIRRWAKARPWLALTTVLITAFLLWHFFVATNPAP